MQNLHSNDIESRSLITQSNKNEENFQNILTEDAVHLSHLHGGRFDFDDGGTYCGGWQDGKAHGHGICTGPKGQGVYSGSWHYGFEVSGVYTWPSGSCFEGNWQNGKRHGLGVETRGRWIYRGEWTQGFKGRYGVRQCTTSTARYEGTWSNGLQDGYGSETYADTGTYQGQWMRGMRQGYGVRMSAPFGLANHHKIRKQFKSSLISLKSNDQVLSPTPEPTEKRDRRIDDSKGGFVLKAKSDNLPVRRNSLTEKSPKKSFLSGLKIRKQKSTGDLEKGGTAISIRSNASTASWMSTESSQSQGSASFHTDSNASFTIEDDQLDEDITETYYGDWKNDKRTGFGISERSDGLRYEGEWFNNRKYGYGVTTFSDGSKEEGKYKNNILVSSQKKKHLFLIRSTKFRERVDSSVNAAQRASKMALQKADIAVSRTTTAQGKAELADIAADHAREASNIALETAKQFAPDFHQSSLEKFKNREIRKYIFKTPDSLVNKSCIDKNLNSDFPENLLVNQTLRQKETSNFSQENFSSNAINSENNQSKYLLENQLIFEPNKVQIVKKYTNNQNSYINGNRNSEIYDSNLKVYQDNHFIPTLEFNCNSQDNFMGENAQENQKNLENKFNKIYNGYPNYVQNSNYLNEQPPQFTHLGVLPSQVQKNPFDLKRQETEHFINGQREQNAEKLQFDETQSSNVTVFRKNNKYGKNNEVPEIEVEQILNDRFDHYKKPPSRDGSMETFAGHLNMNESRQSSLDRTILSSIPNKPDKMLPGNQRNMMKISNPENFEDILSQKKSIHHEGMIGSGQPKRTESLHISSLKQSNNAANKSLIENTGISAQINLQRKQSIQDIAQPIKLVVTTPLTREEISKLGSLRREEVRRQINESEKLKANPLLFLISPQVKDWFSRQQLVMFVLFINISLALMFFKLLT